jgi:uncharacterized RDD family membrane protein YckC
VKGGAKSPDAPAAPAAAKPSSAAPPLPPGAGLTRRLGAMVYDSLLVVALWMATLFPMVALANHAVYGATVQTVLFLELYAFLVFFWLRRGQTLGMLAWKLEVRTVDGGPLTLRQATLRFFGGMLSFACLGLGYLWVLVDHEHRSWTDLLSGTRIVHSTRAAREP